MSQNRSESASAESEWTGVERRGYGALRDDAGGVRRAEGESGAENTF